MNKRTEKINAITDRHIRQMVSEIQLMLDPDKMHDLGGEADFFTFPNGSSFSDFMRLVAGLMEYYALSCQMTIRRSKSWKK
jgi:hypothetical protein